MKSRKVCSICLGVVLGILLIGNTYGATTGGVISEQAFIKQLLALKVTDQALTGGEVPLIREKAAALIVSYLGYDGITAESENTFKDVKDYKGAINLVCEWGILNGTGEQLFSPKQMLSYETAEVILTRLKNKLAKEPQWSHVCYAIQSSSQMEQIKDYSAASFGWAELRATEMGASYALSIDNTASDFKVPVNFEKPIDFAKAHQVETYLMVYMENKGEEAYNLLTNDNQRKQLIGELVDLTRGITKDGVTRGFDGLTIDFEQFKAEELKSPYVTFLKELKAELVKINKKLNVAVQPTLYFKGYDYRGIGEAADHVILMAHDYAAKNLTALEQESGICMTPVTPIDSVYTCLKEASQEIQDKSKLVLQISFDSRQWQLQDGKVIHSTAYTPSYDKIALRLQESDTQIGYDGKYQNAFAIYTRDGIKNMIWYESGESIDSKITLAQLMGIENISYWRLGLMQRL